VHASASNQKGAEELTGVEEEGEQYGGGNVEELLMKVDSTKECRAGERCGRRRRCRTREGRRTGGVRRSRASRSQRRSSGGGALRKKEVRMGQMAKGFHHGPRAPMYTKGT
jgi:hypothetical protein